MAFFIQTWLIIFNHTHKHSLEVNFLSIFISALENNIQICLLWLLCCLLCLLINSRENQELHHKHVLSKITPLILHRKLFNPLQTCYAIDVWRKVEIYTENLWICLVFCMCSPLFNFSDQLTFNPYQINNFLLFIFVDLLVTFRFQNISFILYFFLFDFLIFI